MRVAEGQATTDLYRLRGADAGPLPDRDQTRLGERDGSDPHIYGRGAGQASTASSLLDGVMASQPKGEPKPEETTAFIKKAVRDLDPRLTVTQGQDLRAGASVYAPLLVSAGDREVARFMVAKTPSCTQGLTVDEVANQPRGLKQVTTDAVRDEILKGLQPRQTAPSYGVPPTATQPAPVQSAPSVGSLMDSLVASQPRGTAKPAETIAFIHQAVRDVDPRLTVTPLQDITTRGGTYGTLQVSYGDADITRFTVAKSPTCKHGLTTDEVANNGLTQVTTDLVRDQITEALAARR